MKRAKHKYSIPAKHIRELLYINIIFTGLGAAGTYLLNWGNTFVLVMAVIGLILSMIVWIAGERRRINTTLVAEMNDSTWEITVWMRKPLPIWQSILTPMKNNVRLNEVSEVTVRDINGNPTIILKNNDSNYKACYIPQRLALVPNVKSFLESWLDSKEASKQLKKKNRTIVEDFLKV